MSTIFNFQDEQSQIDAVADGDCFVVYDTSAKTTKYALGSDLNTYTKSNVGVVDTTATLLTLTAASHAGKIVTISSAAPVVITLPQATGTGNKYRFNFRVAATATTSSIKVANATDVMSGFVLVMTTSSANVIGYAATATDDTMKFNGTTMGGVLGDFYEITDIKTGFFQVSGVSAATGTTVTPFLANV